MGTNAYNKNNEIQANIMIYVLLPAYNEGSILRSLLEELAMNLTSLDHRFIVIDDGSKDHTAQAAEEMQKSLPLDIIYHKVNMGLGSSLRDALLYIRDKIRDHDIIITLDADGTHRPEYLSALTSRCTKMTPLVIASRYAKGGGEIGVPNARSLFSRCANRLMQALFPIPRINDYTSGYRAYAGSLILTGFSAYGENLVSEKRLYLYG